VDLVMCLEGIGWEGWIVFVRGMARVSGGLLCTIKPQQTVLNIFMQCEILTGVIYMSRFI
jgi:hypothetical protein